MSQRIELTAEQQALVDAVREAADLYLARTGLAPVALEMSEGTAISYGLCTGSEVAGLRVKVLDACGWVIE